MIRWSTSEQDYMPVPKGVDPDEFRSRKAAGDLRDTARPDQSIRQFKARVLIRQLMLRGGISHGE
jgi:hypothetical protein